MSDMWQKIFQDHGIAITSTGTTPTALVRDADLDRIETEFGIHLPADYRSFCQELGAGTLAELIHVCTPCPNGFGLAAQIEFGWERVEFESGDLPAEVTDDIRSWISLGSTADGYNFYWRIGDRDRTGDPPIYVLTNNWPAEMLHVCDTFTDFVLRAGFGHLLVDCGAYGRIAERPRQFEPEAG